MITYSTNWMGPANMKWYRDRGLTKTVSEVLEEDQTFGDLKAGDTWTYEVITTDCSCGRIDIRGLDDKEYWNGWDEYSVEPMYSEDWNILGDWLDDLTTDTKWSYNTLIEEFEKYYGKKIRWVK